MEAKVSDLRIMPVGMWPRQLAIGRPMTRASILFSRRCEAIDRPKGPAPTMMFSTFIMDDSHGCLRVGSCVGLVVVLLKRLARRGPNSGLKT